MTQYFGNEKLINSLLGKLIISIKNEIPETLH